MTDKPFDPSRRQALAWSFGLTAGTVLPLAGCGGGNGTAATTDTLPEPRVLASSNGQLSLDLTAQYADQIFTVGNPQAAYPGSAALVPTHLRSFNGSYAAPTLVVNIGDTLRIRLLNKLPANVPGQSSLPYLNHQNSTNLHFHGLHVDPREIRPGVFGDYVVDTPEGGVMPGQTRQHEIAIPSDHTNGVYWYHPHLHGATNTQVSSGMWGAILIRDPKDTFITPADGIRERVMHVHKLTVNAKGRTDSFYDSIESPYSGHLLNGAYQPTLVMRPGEVQVWHFINTGSFYPFNPVLDSHTMYLFARDGNVFNGFFKNVDASTAGQFGNQQWPGNAVYPGNRSSLVVKASTTPGTYYLRSSKAAPSSQADEIVARIVVEGDPVSTPLPSPSRLPKYADHNPITDQELAAAGGRQRNLLLAIVPKDDPRVATIPAGEQDEWYIPLGDGADGLANLVFATATPPGKLSPFQSSLTATQTVALNAVEEWTINSANGYPHPFHIHVNDSYVVKVNGEAVQPYWADTLPVPPNGSITFRMRFTDFTGKYVWHCHALDHEDMGMMQLVEVVG